MPTVKIKNVDRKDLEMLGYGGTYQPKSGRSGGLTRAQAQTLRCLNDLPAEEQFDFYCYAYLRDVSSMIYRNKRARQLYADLHKKFDLVWHGNVRRTLPDEPFQDHAAILKNGVDLDALRKDFATMCEFEFTLY